MTERIINKGIHCYITAKGDSFAEGKEYTCTLYYSAKKDEYRASSIATATNIGGEIVCQFVFAPEQTASLKNGSVIMEIYDHETLEQMSYVEEFATVRATSLVE